MLALKIKPRNKKLNQIILLNKEEAMFRLKFINESFFKSMKLEKQSAIKLAIVKLKAKKKPLIKFLKRIIEIEKLKTMLKKRIFFNDGKTILLKTL
jgi:hypothetical protein